MIAHLTNSRYGPLLKIVSKIYYLILVKKRGWPKYNLIMMGELTICRYGPLLKIVQKIYYGILVQKNGPNTI